MSNTKTQHAVGLDVGSAMTRCVVLDLDGDRLRYRGYGDAPSQGWSKGFIADQNAVSASVLAALRAAEHDAGVTIESAVVGVGGNIRGGSSRGLYDLSRLRTVTDEDIRRAVKRATRVRLPEDRLILQLYPQDFIVDGHPGHRDPRKMIAGQIEANVHLATALSREHQILVSAVNEAHIAVEETIFEAFASAYAAVKPQDRTDGFAVLNIGAQSMELIVYLGEAVQLATSLSLSADHFMRDVALVLRIGIDEASALTREFGSAQASSTASNAYLEVPSRNGQEVARMTLNQILEARAQEMFEHVRRELLRTGMDGALLGGLYLAGAGARLEGLCDIAEQILQCRAGIALPVDIRDWPEEIFDPAWTTAAGLAMYSAKLKSQTAVLKQSAGLQGKF